jgi:hypothetical protein
LLIIGHENHGGMNSRYVDPDTGSHVTRAGKRARATAGAAWAYNAIMLRRGSIPNLPNFGSRLRDITHMHASVTREIEQAIDEVLGPEVGKRFRGYEAHCDLVNGAPLFAVTIYSSDGGEDTFEIPHQWSQT